MLDLDDNPVLSLSSVKMSCITAMKNQDYRDNQMHFPSRQVSYGETMTFPLTLIFMQKKPNVNQSVIFSTAVSRAPLYMEIFEMVVILGWGQGLGEGGLLSLSLCLRLTCWVKPIRKLTLFGGRKCCLILKSNQSCPAH